jgi:AraC-like DNA-binding protein
MNALDTLLKTFRLESGILFHADLSEPWGVAFAPRPGSGQFVAVESGRALLRLPGRDAVALSPGDFLFVMGDGGHALQDTRGTSPISAAALPAAARSPASPGRSYRGGGDGARTTMTLSKFHCPDASTHPLWRALPPVILLRREAGRAADSLDVTLSCVADEASSGRPGASAVLDRLHDVLFIEALRGWVRQDTSAGGLPIAVRDTAVASAMALIHDRPADAWTVARLAGAAALSRSAFAERFRRALGESPMGYLTRWRMHLAAQHIGEDRESVAAIAGRVGYESEAAFAKAFKRTVGVAPGAYRRRHRESPREG